MSIHLIEQLSSPIIYAHRGASKYAPENTLAAFKLAFEQSAMAIELDVKLSVDDAVVVIHDQTVDRTTNGTGKVVELTHTYLKSLDAGFFFSQKYQGEKIPTLDEVFELTKGKYLVNIELTNYSTPNDQLIFRVAELVKKHMIQDSVIFSSFLPWNLSRMKHYFPDIPMGLLTMNGIPGVLGRSFLFRKISPKYIHPEIKDVSIAYISSEHDHHRKVNVWTVNDVIKIKWLIEAGVDGIITDDPLIALKLKNEM